MWLDVVILQHTEAKQKFCKAFYDPFNTKITFSQALWC